MGERRVAAQRLGFYGEHVAALWLRLHGWRILARRVKQWNGEIDIIAKRGRTTIFVEVKTRRTPSELDNAIDLWRLRRVAAAVRLVAHQYAGADDELRIDVILIAPWRRPRHLSNVWQDG